jgi:hypothetical protein
MKKSSKSILILVTLISILILCLINSKLIISNILEYSILFLSKLFPVSFIFFIISDLLISYKLIEYIEYYLHLNASKLYVLILSMISGFPSGAKYTKNLLLKDIINIREANSIIKFSHFPNPLFVLSTVSLVLNKSLSISILLSIYISNIIIFLFSKTTSKINNIDIEFKSNFSYELSTSIKNSFNTIILIYGTSLFFYLIAVIILKYINLGVDLYVLINGLFDLTKGVTSVVLLDNIIKRAILILIFISFGTISIHMQVKSIIEDSEIKYSSFLIGRVISTTLAVIIFLIIITIKKMY